MNITKTVASVYSGIDGKCCCGCSGKHSYASEHVDWSSNNRGYQVTQDEVNDRSVKLISNKIFNSPTMKDEGSYACAIVGKRLLIAYFKE